MNILTSGEFLRLALEAPTCEQLRAVVRVLAERAAQDARWGGPEHDDTHLTGEFFHFIQLQLDKAYAEQRDGNGVPRPGGGYYTPKLARTRLTKIAALAIAAMESLDRRGVAR